MITPDLKVPSTATHRPPLPPPCPSNPETSDDLLAAKLAKLREYLQEALDDTNPQTSTLGVTSYELMKLAVHLGQAIDQLLAEENSASEQFRLLAQGVAMMLKLTRQVDRFQQLTMILDETHTALHSRMAGRIDLK